MASNIETVIVFDAVGTLIRTSRSVTTVYHDAGRQFGSNLSLQQVEQKFRVGRREIFGTANLDSTTDKSFPSSDLIEHDLWRELVHFVFDDVQQPDRLFQNLWKHFSEPISWQVFEDVPSCLQELKKLGASICIGSNFDSRIVAIFEHWLPELTGENLYWSSQIGFRKPDKKFYRRIAEQFPNTKQFVMIGDDYINDYKAPIEFGWNAILLDRKSQTATTTHRVPELTQLAGMLRLNARP